jgi:hypothetical protein
MNKLKFNEHTRLPGKNYFSCVISVNDLKNSGIETIKTSDNIECRIVFGVQLKLKKEKIETILFFEELIVLEEWKKLSEAVKKYKEKRGEKKDKEWRKCSSIFKNKEVEKVISQLIIINKDYSEIEYLIDELVDGAEEFFYV